MLLDVLEGLLRAGGVGLADSIQKQLFVLVGFRRATDRTEARRSALELFDALLELKLLRLNILLHHIHLLMKCLNAFAKQILEKEFQITYFEQPSEALNFIGMPDGPFRAVAFPISVQSLRRVRQWLQALIEERPFAYPISVKAQLVHQSINFVEGKAPAWTTNQGQVFFCSLDDTGLSPNGFPVREVAQDGSAAWTLRRQTYVIFIDLPFAGLLDFLSRLMSENGPIRRRNQQELAIGILLSSYRLALSTRLAILASGTKARPPDASGISVRMAIRTNF